MVQVLPGRTRGPSFGDQILHGAASGAVDYLEQSNEKKRLSALESRENEALKKMGLDAAGLSADQKKVALSEMLKGQNKRALLGEKQDFLSNLFNGNQPDQQNPMSNFSRNAQQSNSQMNRQIESEDQMGMEQPEFDFSQLPDESIAQASVVDPNLARAMQHAKDVALREKSSLRTSKEKKESALRQETLPLRSEIANKAKAASEGIQNKEQLLQLIKTGKIDDPTYATLASSLPLNLGKRLLSPETVQYKAGLVDEFKDLKNIFAGATRVKELEILEEKIADLYMTDEQKETILKSRINALRSDMIKAETAAEMESEGKFYGILQFQNELEKRAKPKLEALFNRTLDEQKAAFKDAENLKKIPLSMDDPEHSQIIEQIYQEAGKDPKKAEALAKKKGYSW